MKFLMHRYFCHWTSLLMLAGLCPAVQAQDQSEIHARHTAQYAKCLKRPDAAAGVQPALNLCTEEEFYRQDTILNTLYKQKLSKLGRGAKAKLRATQRTWIKQRDAACDPKRGTMLGAGSDPMLYYGCMIDETIRRILWLERKE